MLFALPRTSTVSVCLRWNCLLEIFSGLRLLDQVPVKNVLLLLFSLPSVWYMSNKWCQCHKLRCLNWAMHQFLEHWPNQIRFQGNYDLVQLLGCRVTLWPFGNNGRLHSWIDFVFRKKTLFLALVRIICYWMLYDPVATQDLPGSSDSLAVKSLRAKMLFFCPPSGLLERTVCSEIFIARVIFNNTTTLTCCWKCSEWPNGKYETMCCLNSQPSHKQTENQWMTSEKQVAVWNISFLVLSFFLFSFDSPSQAWTKMHFYSIMVKAGFEIMIQISRSSAVKCLLSGRISLAFLMEHSTGTCFFATSVC